MVIGWGALPLPSYSTSNLGLFLNLQFSTLHLDKCVLKLCVIELTLMCNLYVAASRVSMRVARRMLRMNLMSFDVAYKSK